MGTLNRHVVKRVGHSQLFKGTLGIGDELIESAMYGKQSGLLSAMGMFPGDLYLVSGTASPHWVIVDDEYELKTIGEMHDGHV